MSSQPEEIEKPNNDPSVPTQVEIEQGDEFGLGHEQANLVCELIKENDFDGIIETFNDLHYADAADVVQQLKPDDRAVVFNVMGTEFDPEVLPELDEDILDEVVDEMGVENVAQVLTEMDTDDALAVIEDLEEDDQKEVLEALPFGDRSLILEGLSFPEDSAGRLMQRDLVSVPSFWNVGETIDYLRSDVDLPDDFYEIFVVDPRHNPLGTIPLSQLMRNKRPTKLSNLMDEQLTVIPVDTDQEEVASIFRDRDLVSAPVADKNNRLLGVITVDDVLDVIDEEHEEDIMRLGGVKDDEFYGNALTAAKSRVGWLAVNLATAILASLIIGLFTETIEQLVALAVLMPIVASMGGNAGTQTLTIAVRAIAMKELTPSNTIRVVGKELMVGSVNGAVFALLVGICTWVWFGDLQLAVVIGIAMVVNMIVAGLAGAVIPVVLDRVGADPAVASSVFLTTVTDVVGFFAFLGLAAIFLL